jgi:hypothetical protein
MSEPNSSLIWLYCETKLQALRPAIACPILLKRRAKKQQLLRIRLSLSVALTSLPPYYTSLTKPLESFQDLVGKFLQRLIGDYRVILHLGFRYVLTTSQAW